MEISRKIIATNEIVTELSNIARRDAPGAEFQRRKLLVTLESIINHP